MSTNKTGAPHRDILGIMSPFSDNSFNFSFNSCNFAGAILYEGIKIVWVSGSTSIANSTSYSRGKPGRSLGNTFKNSLTTRMD